MRMKIFAAIALASLSLTFLFMNDKQFIDDRVNDASIQAVIPKEVKPTLQPYHDIVKAGIERGNTLRFVVEVAGDPNQNKDYEAAYIWSIHYPSSSGERRYTLLITHLPEAMGLNYVGWHALVYEESKNAMLMPLRSIEQMHGNIIELSIDPDLIGNPWFFYWHVYAMVGVDTAQDDSPDYMMDMLPDKIGEDILFVGIG